jgi:hypothetical protein
MFDPQKTVFISYRRSTSAFIARAIYEHLKHSGYDVFMDVESIGAGEFGKIILRQIHARVHFLVILSPGSTARLQNKDDWFSEKLQEGWG